MAIIFEKIRYKNILSTGNTFTEVTLNDNRSTLIIGENGTGKSTILDALSFVLYGKPFRKINKPQLLNSINQKDAVVEIEFKIGKDKYLIQRGIKPTIFQIFKNKKLVNQAAESRDYQKYLEEHILKMNFKSFGQIVVLGKSTFVPFMQLTTQHRREVIEDILDLQIFSTMGVILKERIAANKETSSSLKFEYEMNKSKLESTQNFNTSLNKIKENEKEKITAKIQEIRDNIINLENKISSHKFLKVDRDQFKLKKNHISGKISTINSNIREIDIIFKNTVVNSNFFKDHQNCPTCKQDITIDFKDQSLAKFEKQIEQLNVVRDTLTGRLEKFQTTMESMSELESKINSWAREYELLNIEKNTSNQTILSLEKEVNQIQTTNDEVIDVAPLKQQAKTIQQNIKKNIEQREVLAVLSFMLKDGGLKAQIINQFLPVMNNLIVQYLHSLDFYIDLQIDGNFNEKIVSRFKEDFSYSSFSEGEKARIDLVLLLTWREVARMRNSVSTNLLIMDEIFDGSLDTDGVDFLRKILTDLTGCNIIIISHNVDIKFSEFDRVLQFSKVKNFSIMEQQD